LNPEKGIYARKHWETESISNKNQSYLKSNGRYFNSGVMVLAPKELSKVFDDKILEQLILEYDELGFQWSDQCVLNYIIGGKYEALDRNLNTRPEEYEPMLCRILHFSGNEKPWNALEYRLSLEKAISYRFTNRDSAFLTYFKYERYLLEFLRENSVFPPKDVKCGTN
jgi:lipopolysaccharide biosynthesis glycosyltransferase